MRRPLTEMRKTMCVAAAWLVAAAGIATAGEVTLKNGLVLAGVPRRLEALNAESIRQRVNDPRLFPFLMIENGYQRLFVGQGQADHVDNRDELAKYETFLLKQRKGSYKRASGQVVETSPFDANGQRTHVLNTPQGHRDDIVVGVTKLNPRYISITGLTHQWDYGIATPSVPAAQLDAMLRKANDRKNPDHRFAIARFYLQAGFYEESGKELDSISKDFPELKDRVADAKKELQDFEHRLIVQELARRKGAGQHELAHAYALGVPQSEASASVLHDVQDLLRDYDAAHERIARVRVLLGELQAKLDKSQASAVMPLRSVIDDQLSIEALDRLQAFFNLADDTTLQPSEKLALAYSGWVVGSASAVTDLDLAVRLWQAQHLILQYLREENPRDRKDRLAEIQALDGVGPEMVVKLLRCLPPVIDTTEPVRPGISAQLRVSGRSAEELPSYGVLLPPEYDFRHRYPMIVTLHPAEHSAKAALSWWGGSLENPGLAQRRGYIVIAPEYTDGKESKYSYSVSVHDAVLRAINDARRRFNVDSDRIFLSGHGMGADAAFDLGMSHPDLFAGVIPINGVCDAYCKWYTENAAHTAWYVVTGEFDGRDPFAVDAPLMSRMMRKNADVLLVQFVQRGYEPYFEEGPRIFDWMDLHRRQKPPREFQMKVLRPSESRFYWLQCDGLPQSVLASTLLAGGPVHPMTLGGRISAGNAIGITSGAKSHTLWLSPDLVSFDKRLVVRRVGAGQRYSGMLKPSIEAILDDYRLRADKQLIYTARIDIE